MKFLQILKAILKYGILFILLLGLIVEGPDLHRRVLRERVGSKVVMVTNGMGNGGTGFHIEYNGFVVLVTNNHVCELANFNNDLLIESGDFKVYRKIIKRSKDHDLCLVEPIFDSGLKLANSVDIGETIAVIGHPALFPLSVSLGELIGYNYINVLQGDLSIKRSFAGFITALVYGGSSGSPVVNFFGNVVGVLYAGGRQHQAFIVPLEYLESFLEDEYK